MASSLDWFYGKMREGFGPLSEGDEVFYRKMTTRRPLAVGTCWWVRPRFEERFFCFAESYGGLEMRSIIQLQWKGSIPIHSSGENTIRLNRSLREWQNTIPPCARPSIQPLKARTIYSNEAFHV